MYCELLLVTVSCFTVILFFVNETIYKKTYFGDKCIQIRYFLSKVIKYQISKINFGQKSVINTLTLML